MRQQPAEPSSDATSREVRPDAVPGAVIRVLGAGGGGYSGGGNGGMGSIWSRPEWAGYDNESKFREVTLELYNTGKMHQPRQFGAHPARRPEIWLEAVLPDSELEKNPSVKKAWEKLICTSCCIS